MYSLGRQVIKSFGRIFGLSKENEKIYIFLSQTKHLTKLTKPFKNLTPQTVCAASESFCAVGGQRHTRDRAGDMCVTL